MDTPTNISIEHKSILEQQAEILFPYPFKACVFVIKKTNFLRQRWIIEQIK